MKGSRCWNLMQKILPLSLSTLPTHRHMASILCLPASVIEERAEEVLRFNDVLREIAAKKRSALSMPDEPRWIGWGRELQAIAQTGLHFSESEYDRERYRKILKISVEIFAYYSGESPALIHGMFENQSGYATPKVDVRGVVFHDDRLLLVQERSDGLWTLPEAGLTSMTPPPKP
jgi:hypothetical protein